MDIITGKRELAKVRSINLRIRELEFLIEALYSCIGMQGISYDKISVVSSKDNRFEKIMGDIQELKDEVEKWNKKKAKAINELSKMINTLGECPERTILFGYYVAGMKMEDIAQDLGYEVHYCYKLRDKGIEKL